MDHPITADELRTSYHRAHLWRLGLPLERALRAPLVRRAMELSALARRRSAAARGERWPEQPTLI